MFRLLAAILILYGSIGFSFRLCQELRQRLRSIEQMQEIFRLFQSEISYSRAALPDVCLAVSGRVSEPYKGTMREIYEETIKRSGTQFPDIWHAKMTQCLEKLPLKKEEREIFLEFGNRLGVCDWEMQVAMLEKHRAQLEGLYIQLKSAMANKEKVITSMGILGGLMLIIILI